MRRENSPHRLRAARARYSAIGSAQPTYAHSEWTVMSMTEMASRHWLRAGDRLLAQSVRQAPAWALATALTTLLGGVTSFLVPTVLGTAVDGALTTASAQPWLRLGMVVTADIILLVASIVLGNEYETRVMAWLRHRLFGHAVDIGLNERRRLPTGDLVSRLIADTTAAGRLLPRFLHSVIDGLVGIAAVIALGLIDWRLPLTLLLSIPVVMVAARVFLASTTSLTMRYRSVQTQVTALLVDSLAGIRTIRACGTADRETERVLRPLRELGSTGRALWTAQRQVGWQMALLIPLLELTVLGMAGLGVADGRVSPGELLTTAGYVPLALGVVSQINLLAAIATARASLTRVAEVLLIQPTVRPVCTRGLPFSAGGRVELRSVRVWSGAELVLDEVDLIIEPGTMLAVVGSSGAGKTTMAWLIGRLIDPDDGQILLDGVPLPELDPTVLRNAIAYAFERPALLGESVHEAIAFGRPDLTRTQVEQAARTAQVSSFIRRLPAGYDTRLSQVPLSGGEAQRLGLARLVTRDARVLILDDATAGLDTATEATIVEALAEVRAGRTRVVVAHRESTAARADLVAWLAGGRLRAVATHVDLLVDPAYRALFHIPALTPGREEAA